MLIPMGKTESYQAANSYTNAEVFYESTGTEKTNGKHIECYNGMVYFATKAEAATSSTALKYTSVGFDVTLTGAGKTLTFAVKRGGSLTELTDANVNGTYKYRLYCITTDDLYTLASKVNKADADAIFAADEFNVRMDAIMTTRQNDVDHGAIKENGDGTISVVRNPIYHLNKTSDLNELKKEFNTDFDSFKNITAKLTNYTTTIYYSVGEGVTMNSGYTAKAFTLSGTTVNNTLYQGSSVYKKDYKTLQRFYLLNTGTSGINLKKTGYHLGDGNGGAVWKKSNGETFAITKDYGPKNLSDQAGKKDKIVFLYANWKPGVFTIDLDKQGGIYGSDSAVATYDSVYPVADAPVRAGYSFKGYFTEKNGAGTMIYTETMSSDTTFKETKDTTLYAYWEDDVTPILALNVSIGEMFFNIYTQKIWILIKINICFHLLSLVLS